MIKKIGLEATSLIVVLILAVSGWLTYRHYKHSKDPAMIPITVKEGPIEESVEATGYVAPLNRVEIKPPIGGRIEQLLVDEGDKVKVGQILAWMSSSDVSEW